MKQITILVDDKVGVLADISFILGRSKINIESIDVNTGAGKAVINITVKEPERAKKLLAASNYKVLESDVLVVRLDDRPGELSKMTKMLADNGVNMELVHMLSRGNGITMYSLKLDKLEEGEKLLAEYIRGQS